MILVGNFSAHHFAQLRAARMVTKNRETSSLPLTVMITAYMTASSEGYFYPLPALLPGVRSCLPGPIVRAAFQGVRSLRRRLPYPGGVSRFRVVMLVCALPGLSMIMFHFVILIIMIIIIMSKEIFIHNILNLLNMQKYIGIKTIVL
jgi:hypothetical protein